MYAVLEYVIVYYRILDVKIYLNTMVSYCLVGPTGSGCLASGRGMTAFARTTVSAFHIILLVASRDTNIGKSMS